MKTPLFLAALFLFTYAAYAQYNTTNLCMETEWATLQKLTFKNLRLYPVKANDFFRKAHHTVGNFSNLENAIKDSKVKIAEVTEGGQVNKLYVENTSKDSVFIMAGEVVKGGKQDRVLAQDVILTPGQKIDVSAFCVEHGRWQYGDGNDFKGYSNLSSNDLRKTVVKEKDQGKVWDKVGEITTANGCTSPTGTYTQLEKSEEFQNAMKTYLEKFSAQFDQQHEVIGVVAVTGNKIIGCDLFATHALFRNAYHSLINAYATEAITNGALVNINDQAVKDYINAFLADESKQEKELEKNGTIYNHNGKKMHIAVFDL